MSAMEDMAVSVLSKIVPKSFLDMLTKENLEKLEHGIRTEYQGVKDQLNRIEALLSRDMSIGERMALGEGFIIDDDKEPLAAVMIEDHSNDGSNDSGKPLPGWERFNGSGPSDSRGTN